MASKLARAFPLEADRYLRDSRHRARFSEILNSNETARRLNEFYPDLQHQGWSIRVELTTKEVDLLTGDEHEPTLTLEVIDFTPGLPVVVIRVQAENTEFRLGVPLWQDGAQDWLLDAEVQGRLLLLLESFDEGRYVPLTGYDNLFVDRVRLIAAATLTRPPDADEGPYQMLLAGLQLLQDQPLKPATLLPVSEVVRASIAGRGRSALAVMGSLMAIGTAMDTARSRTEEVSSEGHAGDSPRE